MKPDASKYDPRPEYFAELVASADMTQAQIAKTLGVNKRTISRWLSGERQFPYAIQFAMECLVLSV